MSTDIRYFPRGTMDKDSDYQFIRMGNYVHGYAVRPITNAGSTGWANEIILGNLYAASLGQVESQNQTYRIYVNTIDAATTWQFTAYDQNGQQIFQVDLNVAATPLFVDYVAALDILILAAMPATWQHAITNTTAQTPDTGYFDLTLSHVPYNGMPWTLTVQDIAPATPINAQFDIIAEAIDLSMTGYYRAIGSFDLLGQLFVWATPCTKLAVNLDIVQTGNSGGQIVVSTGTVRHGLTSGEIVSISGTGTSADGIWFVTVISTIQFLLEGSVFGAAVLNLGTVTKNPNAYGTIASVTYDNNASTFSLKKLVRTRKFPFRTKKQIQGEVHKRKIRNGYDMYDFYWVDDLNNPYNMYYQGTFIDDGAIDALNPQTNPGDDGLYDYETIGEETRLLINSTESRLSYTSTTQYGGAVLSGNWLYTHRCVTAENGKTPCQLPLNPVSVSASNEDVSNNISILGSAPGAITPKRIQLEVTGLDPGLFRYVELIGINLITRESFNVWSLGLFEITGDTINIEHSGLNPDATEIAAEEILVETINLKAARHLMSLDSILLLGDLQLYEEYDFTPVSTRVWHQLKREELFMMGFRSNLGNAREYQRVDNIHNKTGYPFNETERFGVVMTLWNGVKTKAFPVDDIKFDLSPTNTLSTAFSPYGQRRGLQIKQITYFNDLPVPGTATLLIETEGESGFIVGDSLELANVAGLAPLVSINTTHVVTQVNTPTQFNVEIIAVVSGTYTAYSGHVVNSLPNLLLTNDPVVDPTVNGLTYNFYVEFSSFPWDYMLPDGKRVRDVVKSIEYVRCETIPEVMMSGFVLPSLLDPDGVTYIPQRSFSSSAGGSANYVVPLGDNRRRIAFFTSPDILYDLNRVSYQTGDQFILFGTSNIRYTESHVIPAGVLQDNYFEFNGFYSLSTTPFTVNLENALNTYKGDPGSTITGATFGPVLWATQEPTTGNHWDVNMVLLSDNTTFFETALPNTGVYFGQYFRPRPDKYGTITQGVYQPTGHYFEPGLDQGDFINNQKVYGGDTFTQKTYHHLYYKSTTAQGGFIGMSFYSQNKANTQKRFYNPDDPGFLYPAIMTNTATWIQRLSSSPRDQFNYNKGYSQFNLISRILAYNPNLDTIVDMPATAVWTQTKIMGSSVDSWRIILPADIKHFDLSKGVLTGMWALNGELYILQQRAFLRLFFNSRGVLKTLESEEIILGSGDVLSRDGISLSTIGCDSKWAQCRGKSESGDDTLYWFNWEHKKFLRFAADGTQVISDIKGMESWFANFTKWLKDKDTPADDEGTHMAWVGRFGEVHITFRGRRASTEWLTGTNYTAGDVVRLDVQPLGTDISFAKTTQLYVARTTHFSGAGSKPETGATWETQWEKIEHTNTDYYNEYTLIYSEKKKGFIGFNPYLPTIYLPWTNNVLTPGPSLLEGEGVPSAQDRLFLHNTGVYAEFYKSMALNLPIAATYTQGSTDVTGSGFLTYFGHPEVFKYTIPIGGVDYYIESVTDDSNLVLTQPVTAVSGTFTEYYISQADKAYITMVVNEIPNIFKLYEALQLNTEIKPFFIYLQTPDHESFLEPSDFEDKTEGFFYAAVKYDSSGTGINDGNSDDIFGPWILMRLDMEPYVYQNIKNLVVRIEQTLPNSFQP